MVAAVLYASNNEEDRKMRYMHLLCAVIGCFLLAAGCTGTAPQQAAPADTQSPQATAAAQDTGVAAAPTAAVTTSSVSDNTVNIKEMAFDPATITVTSGSIVRWVNRDSAIHSVVFSDTSINPSGTLSASQSFSVRFTTPGTYAYHCGIHPKVTGTVVVT
jgi:plastocyanin